MYDMANSAYSVVITTAIFPIYYKAVANEAGVSAADSTAYLGYTISIATFILAMLGPILGSVADFKDMKRKFFTFFFLLGSLSTIGLVLVPEDQWLLLLIIYTLTAIGARGANLFYDAYLVDVTERDKMDDLSAKGFAVGYIGSVIPFILSISVIILSQQEILPLSVGNASKIAFLITAIWWILFTIPLLKNVRQKHWIERKPRIVANSFKELKKTFLEIKQHKAILLFLIAYFFYIDGVGTIISMSTAYGTDVGLGATDLIIALLAVQIVAAPFAMLFGRLARKFGAKRMIYVGFYLYHRLCVRHVLG